MRHTNAAVFDELVTQAYYAREIQSQANGNSVVSPCSNDDAPMEVDEPEADGKQDPPVLPNVNFISKFANISLLFHILLLYSSIKLILA